MLSIDNSINLKNMHQVINDRKQIVLIRMVDQKALKIIKDGGIKLRVQRSGMLQVMPFKIKKIPMGKDYYVELFLDRLLDMSELQRVSNETMLPVEAENGRAFPEGLGAKDFLNL